MQKETIERDNLFLIIFSSLQMNENIQSWLGLGKEFQIGAAVLKVNLEM